jgi:YD repeat-containing protein
VLTQTSIVNGNQYTLNKVYDDLGRISQLTYPDGEQVGYTYDGEGNMLTAGAYATFSNYTGPGQPQSINYGNSATSTLSYNTTTNSRLNNVTTNTSPAAGNTQIQNLSYTYDGDGNVLTIADGTPNSTGTETFVYDGMSRLTSASSTNSTYGQGGQVIQGSVDDPSTNYVNLESDVKISSVWSQQYGTWYIPGESGANWLWAVAHEAGHLLGLLDQYIVTGTNPDTGQRISVPNPGYDGNIMAEIGAKGITEEDINGILYDPANIVQWSASTTGQQSDNTSSGAIDINGGLNGCDDDSEDMDFD